MRGFGDSPPLRGDRTLRGLRHHCGENVERAAYFLDRKASRATQKRVPSRLHVNPTNLRRKSGEFNLFGSASSKA
jgi:hypothetical protein